MTKRIIEWRFVPAADGWEEWEPDAVAWIDVAALDKAWRATEQYIEPGGANGQDNRYARVGEWFAENLHCDMGFASLDGKGLWFTDGRHRFAWLRDHGVLALPLQVPPDQATEFRQRFGVRNMQSILPRDTPS